jgi:hypothetical protein
VRGRPGRHQSRIGDLQVDLALRDPSAQQSLPNGSPGASVCGRRSCGAYLVAVQAPAAEPHAAGAYAVTHRWRCVPTGRSGPGRTRGTVPRPGTRLLRCCCAIPASCWLRARQVSRPQSRVGPQAEVTLRRSSDGDGFKAAGLQGTGIGRMAGTRGNLSRSSAWRQQTRPHQAPPERHHAARQEDHRQRARVPPWASVEPFVFINCGADLAALRPVLGRCSSVSILPSTIANYAVCPVCELVGYRTLKEPLR